MSEERNTFLTEAMGGCAQDQGYYRDSGYLCCKKCRSIVNGPEHDQCLGVTNFSLWSGFGKLWPWCKEQPWFEDAKKHVSFSQLIDLIEPDKLADAVYNYLRSKK